VIVGANQRPDHDGTYIVKFLLVEDDAVTRDYVEAGLIGAGHSVDVSPVSAYGTELGL